MRNNRENISQARAAPTKQLCSKRTGCGKTLSHWIQWMGIQWRIIIAEREKSMTRNTHLLASHRMSPA